MALFDYVEVLYNQRRRHSTLGQISPAALLFLVNSSRELSNRSVSSLLTVEKKAFHHRVVVAVAAPAHAANDAARVEERLVRGGSMKTEKSGARTPTTANDSDRLGDDTGRDA